MTGTHVQFAIIGGGIVGTFLADQLTRRGASVAVIERGPAKLESCGAALPPIECAKRPHQGAYKARNHVLGGNGHFWGGGLVRPPSTRLGDVLGADVGPSDIDLRDHFSAVETELAPNFRPVRMHCGPESCGIGPLELSEAMVLAGGARNISAGALGRLAKNKLCQIFVGAEIARFNRKGPRVTSIDLWADSGTNHIEADVFVLAAGTIDSNLVLLRHAQELGIAADIGRGLHEHLSVPMYSVTGFGSAKLRKLIAPGIRNGAIVGRRFEISPSATSGQAGFVHFQFPFDDFSPYREIKEFMSLRQKRVGLRRLALSGLKAVAHLPSLAMIGFERYALGRLLIHRSMAATATLDFESQPNLANRIDLSPSGLAKLSWDIQAEDELAFAELAVSVSSLMKQLRNSFDASVWQLGDFESPHSCVGYLREHAVDAYHLGGGIPIGSAIDSDLRLIGIDNAFVISGAVMQKAGIVNPVLTLLALARRFVCDRLPAAGGTNP